MTLPLTFVTLSEDREVFAELSGALTGNERTRLLADSKNADELLSAIVRLRPTAALVVADGKSAESSFKIIKRVAAEHPDVAVIAASRSSSPSIILGSMRAGAREFLQLPIKADEFGTVLDRTDEFRAALLKSQPKKSGRVVGVFSSKGGCGVSFVATNLAASMGGDTLLADLNLQAGDSDSFLGIDARYSISDVAKNITRLDDALLSNFITSHSARLSLLAAPAEAHEAEDIRPEHVTEILHLLRQRFDFVVLDLQHTFDPVTVAAMDQSDDVLLVLTLDIPGIRRTKRALKIFDRIGYPRRKIHVVVNRHGTHVEVEQRKVETHLGESLIGFVPNDYRNVMESINMGRPLVESDPGSKIAAEIKRIAGLLSGQGQRVSAQPRKGLLKSLFNREEAPSLELRGSLDEV